MDQNFKLGNFVQISIGNVQDIEKSKPFYQNLGYSLLAEDSKPYPWAQFSDGAVNIVLNEDGMDYLGITYFAPDMQQRGKYLEEQGIHFENFEFKVGNFYQKTFLDPNKFGITIIEYNGDKVPQVDLKKNVALGRFGEFAIPTKNLEESLLFWQKLGYKVCGKYSAPYNWAILSDDLMVIGLHEASNFQKPAITYFAKDMKDKIQKFKSKNMKLNPFEEGCTEEKNMTVISPEGHVFFLFEGQLD